MSIENQRDQIVFECDGNKCNEFLETGTRDFNGALNELNAADWKSRKVGNTWFHVCPACAEDETANAFG